jgi:transposase
MRPHQHLVDSAYVSAEEILNAHRHHDIQIIGPARPDVSWQSRTEDAFDYSRFEIDWEKQQVRCPNGCYSQHWYDIDQVGDTRAPGVKVRFRKQDCLACPLKAKCTRSKGERQLRLPSRDLYENLEAARTYITSEEGAALYKKRAGIEGTISQAVRAYGFRQARYIGREKTHLQHIAIAAAMNLERLVAWFWGVNRAQTRISAFAALAPA